MKGSTVDWSQARIERDELNLLAELVPLAGLQVIELGCGSARLGRRDWRALSM